MKNDIIALFAAIEGGPTKIPQETWETGSIEILPMSTCSQTPNSDAERMPSDITAWRLPHLGHYVHTPECSVLYLSLRRLREPALPKDSESLCGDLQSLAIAIINDSLPLHGCSLNILD